MNKTRLVVFSERRQDWISQHKNLKEAKEKARFLQKDLELDKILAGFKKAGLDVYEIQNTKQLIQFMQENKNNFGGFVAWNITDGQDIFLGSHFASFANLLKIPVLNCNSYVQGLSQFKDHHLAILKQNSILVPNYYTVYCAEDLEKNKPFEGPYIVKPAKLDNSVGIRNDSVVQQTWENALKKTEELFREYETPIQIEEFIPGTEITIPFAFLNGKWRFSVFEVRYNGTCQTIEIKDNFQKKVLNAKKYEKQGIEIAKKIITVLGIDSYGRLDFRVNKNNELVLIEFNSGASQTGLAWQKAISEWGYSFIGYLETLVKTKRRKNE